MSDFINYDSLELPDNEQYDKWTYAERRAYLLSVIRRTGYPRAINQAQLARLFDVSPPTIHNDIDILADYINDTLGDRRHLTTAAVVERSILGLLEDGEYRKAAQTALDWNEWVARESELAEVKNQLADLLEERARRQGAAGCSEGEGAPSLEGVTLSLGGDDR